VLNRLTFERVFRDEEQSDRRYTYGAGDTLTQQTGKTVRQGLSAGGAPTGHYLLYDGHGSTRVLVDGDGAIIMLPAPQVFAHDAFGLPVGFSPSAALTTLLYSGERLDTFTGEKPSV
jgi:hypothetical protein